jgi:hypothetical protein
MAIRNVFDQVLDDAVRQARLGDARTPASGANYAATPVTGDSEPLTFADEEGNSIAPFQADIDPVDDPRRYIL